MYQLPETASEEDDPTTGRGAARELVLVWLSAAAGEHTTRLAGQSELVIGREADCDVVLPDPLISRRHAQLVRRGETWFIRDLDSNNGVHVNGEPAGEAVLSPGGVVRLGSFVGTLLELPAGVAPRYGLLDAGLFGGPDISALMELVQVAAASELSVVLEGATGTGKEQFARAIHRQSGRAGEFVAINCALYQPATAVAELFGYRRGAFTSAERAHPGMIRAADGGTLLLDEIGDLSLEVQAQLLRVIEQGELTPLGEARPVAVRVRYLAATQRPLAELVAAGRFRADLRARLEGLRLRLPPLHERRGEVPFLFLHLLRTCSSTPPVPDGRVLERLCSYDWPLNVRELAVLARRLCATYPGAQPLRLEQVMRVFPELQAVASPSESSAPPLRRRRVDARGFRPDEIAALKAALDRHAGSVARAAAELRITRQRAYRMLKGAAD